MSSNAVQPQKSMAVAYILWFFLGSLGIHRFYLGKSRTAVFQLLLFILGIILTIVGIGLILIFALGVWLIVDAFLIPGLVRNYNPATVQRINLSSGVADDFTPPDLMNDTNIADFDGDFSND